MKRLKQVSAVVLALLLVLCLNATAFAAGTETGTITISSNSTTSVNGRTFNAYKVLDAEFAGTTADGKREVAYTVPTELEDFYATRYTLDKTEAGFDQEVVAQIAKEPDMFKFAADVLAAAKTAGITPKTATGQDKKATINALPFGYYVIEDASNALPVSALMLQTAGNVNVDIKAATPSIDKKIDGAADTDPSTTADITSNNAAIGDTVPYVLTSKVPDMTGYKKYFFVVHDTLSKGLTFNNDVSITIGGNPLTRDIDYTVTTNVEPDGSTSVKIVFIEFYANYNQQAGAEIKIKYTADVNSEAVIGTAGNPNTAHLVYSNNPNVEFNGTNEPEGEDPHGETPDSITKTFVTGIDLIKIDPDKNHLAGAEFELKGERLNTVLRKTNSYVEDPNGDYWKLKDGTYTKDDPNDVAHNQDDYESLTVRYKKQLKTETITKSETVQYKGTVGDDGVMRFDGLAAGKYIITELKAPHGYNLLANPIEITITCVLPDEITKPCVWKVTSGAKVSADGNRIELAVVNQTGTELPSTGGIGTTIFYIVGGLLMIAAVVLLVTKKKMSGHKDD